jgi:hypothetical protein
MTEQEKLEIAAKHALEYVYADFELDNTYHATDTDGLNSKSHYDLYCKIKNSYNPDIYYIEDGDASKIGDNYYRVFVLDDVSDSPVYYMHMFFDLAKDVIQSTIDQELSNKRTNRIKP